MVAIMTCGTAGGTAGQIAEIRVTLTSSDHREACDSSLCATHPIHHHLRVHRTSATNHIMVIPISNVIIVCRIVVGYPSSIHVDIEQCVCLNHIL